MTMKPSWIIAVTTAFLSLILAQTAPANVDDTIALFRAEVRAMKEAQKEHNILVNNLLTRKLAAGFAELKAELKADVARHGNRGEVGVAELRDRVTRTAEEMKREMVKLRKKQNQLKDQLMIELVQIQNNQERLSDALEKKIEELKDKENRDEKTKDKNNNNNAEISCRRQDVETLTAKVDVLMAEVGRSRSDISELNETLVRATTPPEDDKVPKVIYADSNINATELLVTLASKTQEQMRDLKNELREDLRVCRDERNVGREASAVNSSEKVVIDEAAIQQSLLFEEPVVRCRSILDSWSQDLRHLVENFDNIEDTDAVAWRDVSTDWAESAGSWRAVAEASIDAASTAQGAESMRSASRKMIAASEAAENAGRILNLSIDDNSYDEKTMWRRAERNLDVAAFWASSACFLAAEAVREADKGGESGSGEKGCQVAEIKLAAALLKAESGKLDAKITQEVVNDLEMKMEAAAAAEAEAEASRKATREDSVVAATAAEKELKTLLLNAHHALTTLTNATEDHETTRRQEAASLNRNVQEMRRRLEEMMEKKNESRFVVDAVNEAIDGAILGATLRLEETIQKSFRQEKESPEFPTNDSLQEWAANWTSYLGDQSTVEAMTEWLRNSSMAMSPKDWTELSTGNWTEWSSNLAETMERLKTMMTNSSNSRNNFKMNKTIRVNNLDSESKGENVTRSWVGNETEAAEAAAEAAGTAGAAAVSPRRPKVIVVQCPRQQAPSLSTIGSTQWAKEISEQIAFLSTQAVNSPHFLRPLSLPSSSSPSSSSSPWILLQSHSVGSAFGFRSADFDEYNNRLYFKRGFSIRTPYFMGYVFWLGLEKMAALSSFGEWELLVRLKWDKKLVGDVGPSGESKSILINDPAKGSWGWSLWRGFKVLPESRGFKLVVGKKIDSQGMKSDEDDADDPLETIRGASYGVKSDAVNATSTTPSCDYFRRWLGNAGAVSTSGWWWPADGRCAGVCLNCLDAEGRRPFWAEGEEIRLPSETMMAMRRRGKKEEEEEEENEDGGFEVMSFRVDDDDEDDDDGAFGIGAGLAGQLREWARSVGGFFGTGATGDEEEEGGVEEMTTSFEEFVREIEDEGDEGLGKEENSTVVEGRNSTSKPDDEE